MDFSARLRTLTDEFSGTLGAAAVDLRTGATLAFNAHDVFPAASTIKIPVMVEAFRRVVAGALALDTPLVCEAAHRTSGSGILKTLSPGLVLPLRDVLTLMIIVSDNTATNMVLDVVGVDAVNACMRGLGLPQLILYRKIRFDQEGPLAEGTPAAFCDLLARLAQGRVVSPQASAQMVAILRQQQYTDMIGRYIPYDSDASEEDPDHTLSVATKSGSVRGVRNDVGLVFPPGRAPYAVALMSKECRDQRFWADNEGRLAIARLSGLIYDEFVGG